MTEMLCNFNTMGYYHNTNKYTKQKNNKINSEKKYFLFSMSLEQLCESKSSLNLKRIETKVEILEF